MLVNKNSDFIKNLISTDVKSIKLVKGYFYIGNLSSINIKSNSSGNTKIELPISTV